MFQKEKEVIGSFLIIQFFLYPSKRPSLAENRMRNEIADIK
jgi:hypothetical protein